MGGWIKGWKGEGTKEWMNSWMDGWMDDHEQTKNVSMHVTFLQNLNPNMKS
jgi:hypothetical protein